MAKFAIDVLTDLNQAQFVPVHAERTTVEALPPREATAQIWHKAAQLCGDSVTGLKPAVEPDGRAGA